MKRSFRNVLTLILVAVAMVPVLVLSYPLTALVSRLVERNAARETELIAERLMHDFQADIRMLVAQAQALSRDSDIQRGTRSILFSEKAKFLMKRFLEDNPLVGATYLLDETFNQKSQVVENVDANIPSVVARIKKDLNEQIADDRGYYRFFISSGNVFLVVPVQGPLGRPTGLLLLGIPSDTLRRRIAGQVKSPMVAHLGIHGLSEVKEDNPERDFRAEVPFEIASSENGGISPRLSMKIAVFEPRAIRLEAVRRSVRWMLFCSVLFALVAGACGYYLAYRLNRPFRRLNQQLQKYEAGEYGAALPVFSIDEFRLIAGTLQSMAGKISGQIQLAAENERARGEVERVRLETELHSLHQQMQPHFLFNTLNSIGAMIHIDADRAGQLVNRFSDLYRLILEMGRTNTVPLEKEMTVVSHYLELQQVRFGVRLRYQLEWDPALRDVHVPGLMLQTLVENALKHGIGKSRDGGEVRVKIIPLPTGYRCEIVNTGSPLLRTEERTGLQNTRRRLTLLYGNTHQFCLQAGEQNQTIASFIFSGKPI
ncbi:MAG TPA: hypothetical protein DCS07_07080 [Bdellovibrionales bacterium]|nr:MAG: hypothetical protein A2X97_02365 [Bdellovibrionales bacterium GWA1_52_35]OFZ36132.1 MAG: hypothetical protein A2070_04370 [Bdellovibrionales bacterium GWC1_52_8]HAR42382.1 hypothetical protein [Bdellovibrionales bacterium]HCM40034.1 hypothetical protein [Bdellovibrionales bacterium]